MMKYATMNKEELERELAEARSEIFKMTSELRVTRKLEKPHLLKSRKKDCARILTVLRRLGSA